MRLLKKVAMPANIKLFLIKFWLPVLACAGFIFYISSVPGSNIPSLFPYEDIAYHFLIYLSLGYLFSRALKNTYPGTIRTNIILFTVLFGIIYGLSDEFHQAFVPLRSVSVIDWINDSLGTLTGSILFVFTQ